LVYNFGGEQGGAGGSRGQGNRGGGAGGGGAVGGGAELN